MKFGLISIGCKAQCDTYIYRYTFSYIYWDLKKKLISEENCLVFLSEDPSSVPSIHISKQWKIFFPCFFFCTAFGWKLLVITWSKILIPSGSRALGTLFLFCGSSCSLYSLFNVEASTGNSLSSKTDLSCQAFVSEATLQLKRLGFFLSSLGGLVTWEKKNGLRISVPG